MDFYFKELKSTSKINQFWEKKRQYEESDIFPNLPESGAELDEIVDWFRSSEYYELIMDLHNSPTEGDSQLEFVFIYNNQQEYVGFTTYKIYYSEDSKAFILDFCIDKPFRNQGVGSRVVSELKNYLKAKNALYIALNASNERNQRFWQNQGFIPQDVDENGEVLYIFHL